MKELKITNNDFFLDYSSKIVQLGSCFSTNISNKFKEVGFSVNDNPFGVLFHPTAILNLLEAAIYSKYSPQIVQKEDVYFDYQASGECFSMNEDDLKHQLQNSINQLNKDFKEASVLFVTFGTAKAFLLNSSKSVVANCHKQAKELFYSELLDISIETEKWNVIIAQLKEFNPNLKIVFTVSPVRYAREGWEENNRSKARLFLLIENLLVNENVSYFPSYERINDVLRDYCFYEEDGLHPNKKAITIVWEDVKNTFFTENQRDIVKQAEQLRKLENHRLLYPESIESKRFVEILTKKRESFLSLHSYINW